MPYVTVGKENGANIDIYYKDWGKGQPIVFSHGWPLSADDWDPQMLFFLSKGYESDVAIPLTNAAKELYRLAMREGYATEDFSAIYDFLTTISQKSKLKGTS